MLCLESKMLYVKKKNMFYLSYLVSLLEEVVSLLVVEVFLKRL